MDLRVTDVGDYTSWGWIAGVELDCLGDCEPTPVPEEPETEADDTDDGDDEEDEEDVSAKITATALVAATLAMVTI